MEDGCYLGDLAEPQRKRRCLRFSSAEEDALIVSDSGFGDLSSEDDHTHSSSSSSIVSVTFGSSTTTTISSSSVNTAAAGASPLISISSDVINKEEGTEEIGKKKKSSSVGGSGVEGGPSFSNYHQIQIGSHNHNSINVNNTPPEDLLFFPDEETTVGAAIPRNVDVEEEEEGIVINNNLGIGAEELLLEEKESNKIKNNTNNKHNSSLLSTSTTSTSNSIDDDTNEEEEEEQGGIGRKNNSSSNINKNNSSSSSTSSSASEEHEESSSSSASSNNSVDDSFLDILLNSSEICGNPSKAAMIQRFISHLRNNPGDAQLQHFLALLLSGPEFSPPRHRLRHVTSLHDAVRLLRVSKRILVLTGAGISVSCGIPDFRSKDGLYSRVAKVFPELRDPQSVFDIRLFRRDPRAFFLTAKELYPGQFAPSLSHKFIRRLESRGQLLRNYSQNIDTLEQIAGIQRVTMCHGSFATASCIRCGVKVDADAIKEKVLAGEVPFCEVCSSPEETKNITFPLGEVVSATNSNNDAQQQQVGRRRGTFDDDDDEDDEYSRAASNFPLPPVVKPDIVFFGEDLPDEFHANLQVDKPLADLVVVIGSSLRVRPVSLIPGMVPPEVPQILINRESLPHCRFDVELLGNCDSILAHLASLLGPDFENLASGDKLKELDKLPPKGINVDILAAADGEGLLGPKVKVEIEEPKSEHDIQALKACWEPKTNEKITDRLPRGSYLKWRPRQYIFEGAEEIYDPDEEDDESSQGSSSSSSDSESSNEDEDQQTKVTNEKFASSSPASSLSQSNQQ